jgi:glycosyltransferase involved in cell wall biosynthesis
VKILFIAPRYHTNQYHVVKALQDHGHEVYFHVTLKGTTEDYTLVKPLVVKQSKFSVMLEKILKKRGANKPLSFPSSVEYWKKFLQLKPHIVVIRDPNRYFSRLAAAFALILGSKIVFFTQEALYRPRKFKTRLKQKLYIKLFRAVWMTPIVGEQIDGDKIDGMYYIPLPVHVENNEHTHNKVSDERFKILFIGKFHQERKKHSLLLDALYQLKDRFEFKATIIGECYTEQQISKFNYLQQKVTDYDLSGYIELVKNVPYSEINKYYKTHDIFALPAVDEPYAISVSEALGYGLPVICTDTCGARYHIRNGINGYVIKSNSLQDLVAALKICFQNREFLELMSCNSRKYAINRLSRETFIKNFREILQK